MLEIFKSFPLFMLFQDLLVAVHQNHNEPQLQNHNQHVHHYLWDHCCELWVGCREINNVDVCFFFLNPLITSSTYWGRRTVSRNHSAKICICKSRLTYSHHVEFYLLLHCDLFIIPREVKCAMNGAAVRPYVIVCDIVNINGRCLHITAQCAMPLYTVTEVFVEDITVWMVIVKNLRQQRA